MKRNQPNAYLAAGVLGLGLLMCGPSIAGEHNGGSRDRQTTEWTLPSRSMRDLAKERAADRQPAEEPAETRTIEPPHPDDCIKC